MLTLITPGREIQGAETLLKTNTVIPVHLLTTRDSHTALTLTTPPPIHRTYRYSRY